MDTWTQLLEPLLVDLSFDEQQALLRRIDSARDEQLARKLHPTPRRRRNSFGVPNIPPERGA